MSNQSAHSIFDIVASTKDGGDTVLDRPPETKVFEKPQAKKPKMYKVVMHNDNVTPVSYVMLMLQSVFNRSAQDAANLTMAVHQQGQAIAGTFAKEIAEAKLKEAEDFGKRYEMPLMEQLASGQDKITFRLSCEPE